MKRAFRQSMAWLHTWVGLLAGWLLFFVFLTGTLSYVRFEIDRWMMPELPLAAPALPARALLQRAASYASAHAPDAQRWRVLLPLRRTRGELVLLWEARPGRGTGGHVAFNPSTGQPHDVPVRDTGGGSRLYEMHYRLHYVSYEVGIQLVGAAAMCMLIATVTGVIVHKKIFTDFFTLRRSMGQRSWLDAHNVAGVLALPFHLLITYSGLVLLSMAYMPAAPAVMYPNQVDQFYDEAFGDADEAVPDAPQAGMAPLAAMLDEVERRWGADAIRLVTIAGPGRANAAVTFLSREARGVTFGRDTLSFDGRTGALTGAKGADARAVMKTYQTLLGLHIADFAGPLLRALFVMSGLMSTALIGTGLVLWTVKRRARLVRAGALPRGFALVERLNAGTLVGLPLAIAVYFWANRLLPLDLAERHDWEVQCLFLTWAAAFAYAACRRIERASVDLLCAASLAYAGIPLLNALTTHRHLGVTVPAGDWALAAVDLTALAVGLSFAIAARRRRRGAMPRAQAPPAARALPEAG